MKPTLLYSQGSVVFPPALACLIGVNEAIVFQRIVWLCEESSYGEVHENRRWIYNTPEGWRYWFPFFSASTIRRTLEALREMRLVDTLQIGGASEPLRYTPSASCDVVLKRLAETESERLANLTNGTLKLDTRVRSNWTHACAQIEQQTETSTKTSPKSQPTPMAEREKGITEGKESKLIPTTAQSKRIAALFHRRLTTAWSEKEVAAYKRIGTVTDDVLEALERYYAAQRAMGDEGRHRRDLGTFLNNFAGEVDRAMAWGARNGNGNHGEQPKGDPADWKDFLTEKSYPAVAYDGCRDYLRDEFILWRREKKKGAR